MKKPESTKVPKKTQDLPKTAGEDPEDEDLEDDNHECETIEPAENPKIVSSDNKENVQLPFKKMSLEQIRKQERVEQLEILRERRKNEEERAQLEILRLRSEINVNILKV